MNTWLTAIVSSIALGGCAYSSSGVDSGNALSSSCYGPNCGVGGSGSAAGGVGNSNGSMTLVVKTDVDAGSTWSPLCGPQDTGGPEDAGCQPDPDAGSCNDEYAASAGVDGGPAGIQLTCRIRPVADSHNIERQCEGAGPGKSGDPCQVPTDCGSGLTCVAEDLAGLCRPYCCADPESCPSNSYCTTRTTLINRDPWVLGSDVPVCLVAENCPLTESYPCPSGQNCTCPAGKACMVVRRHGLTACVKPGSGLQGDYCPCAAGYVCSNVTFTCLKLCPLSNSKQPSGQAATNSPCATGTSCQASNDVPQDWGVCSDVPMLVN